jgi:hypothetical protein
MIMSTQVLTGGEAFVGQGSGAPGLLRRILQHVVDAQARRAAVLVRQYLAGLSDEQLAELGHGPAAIEAIRKHANGVGAAWL